MNIRKTTITATAIAAAMAGLSMGLAASADPVTGAGDKVAESNSCSGASADKDEAKADTNGCGAEKDKAKADANGCGGPNGCGAAK